MNKKFLAFTIAVSILIGLFVSSNAYSAWMGDATIKNVRAGTSGHTIRAYVGTWDKVFIVPSDNDWAFLSVALTAISTGQLVTIEYTGDTIDNIWILE